MARRDLDAIDELHAAAFVGRSPAGRGREQIGYPEGVADLFRALPDFVATIDGLAIDEVAGQVAIRGSATGTHAGEFLGAAPTGRSITSRASKSRGEGGRIAERWGEWDGIDILG